MTIEQIFHIVCGLVRRHGCYVLCLASQFLKKCHIKRSFHNSVHLTGNLMSLV